MLELANLQGVCVALEPLCERHAAALFPVLSDPKLWRFTDDVPPTSRAALADRYRRLESRRSPDGSQYWLNWAIVAASNVVGFVQATLTDDAAEIAYVVGNVHQSRGYATDAVRAMLAYLEDSLDIKSEYATVDARNAPSRRLLEHLGFALVVSIDAHNLRFFRSGRR